MADFIIKDGRHYVSLVTGPSHVLLGVAFTREPVEPTMIRRPASGGCFHGELDEGEIRAAVREALAAFRADGAEIHAAEIVYVENDSPRYEMFQYAATLLARRYLEGGEPDSGGWRHPPE